ncbi:hypothetical protein LPJ57_009770, partial [Coemansia sp. RSA 486]
MIILAQAKLGRHPREEVCQRVVPSTHALGDACAAAGERQGSDRIMAHGHNVIDAGLLVVVVVAHNVVCFVQTQRAVVLQHQRGHRACDVELGSDVLLDLFRQGACALKHNQASWLGHRQVDVLAGWRICRINDAVRCASHQDTQDGDHKVSAAVGVDDHDIFGVDAA